MKVGLVGASAKAAAFLVLVCAAQSSPTQAAEVKFFAGGGFRSAANELVTKFEKETGHKVVATFDSQGGLQKRVAAGEPFDVILIGPGLVDPLVKQGKVVDSTRANVVRAGLGVAVKAGAKKPDVGSVDAFKRTLLEADSVAYIGEGHSGEFFRATLEKLAIAEQMKAKLKPMGTAQLTKAVGSGEAALAVWVIPGLLADKGVELAGPVPSELQDYVELTAGLSSAAAAPDAGRTFIKLLTSDAAKSIAAAKGWESTVH